MTFGTPSSATEFETQRDRYGPFVPVLPFASSRTPVSDLRILPVHAFRFSTRHTTREMPLALYLTGTDQWSQSYPGSGSAQEWEHYINATDSTVMCTKSNDTLDWNCEMEWANRTSHPSLSFYSLNVAGSASVQCTIYESRTGPVSSGCRVYATLSIDENLSDTLVFILSICVMEAPAFLAILYFQSLRSGRSRSYVDGAVLPFIFVHLFLCVTLFWWWFPLYIIRFMVLSSDNGHSFYRVVLETFFRTTMLSTALELVVFSCLLVMYRTVVNTCWPQPRQPRVHLGTWDTDAPAFV
jgi:hypothetical protein